ncbi:hypothetical protein D3C73_1264780 [compost metagenome]
MVMRTTKASISTPNAIAKPSGRTMVRWLKMKPENTLTMMIAAAVTTAAAWLNPERTACLADSPCMNDSRMPDVINTW